MDWQKPCSLQLADHGNTLGGGSGSRDGPVSKPSASSNAFRAVIWYDAVGPKAGKPGALYFPRIPRRWLIRPKSAVILSGSPAFKALRKARSPPSRTTRRRLHGLAHNQ